METGELAVLTRRLREGKLSSAELRRLYELTGEQMRAEHGVLSGHNPCSLAAVTESVLKLSKRLAAGSLLNVGLGGYPILDLELSKRGFRVTGVEYAESLTRLASDAFKQSKTNAQAVCGDGIALPFREAAFDNAICSETLEHIPDDRAVLAEIHRVLKPEGKILVTVPCVLALIDARHRIASKLKGGSAVLHPTHLREYTYFSIRTKLKGLFSIEHWEPVPFTVERFGKMPYEKALSLLVSLPLLRHFSLSIAFVARKD